MASKPLEVTRYSFVDAVPLPGDIGVRDGNTIGQLIENVKGINHYIDFIAFGEKTLLNDKNVSKPGLRSFVPTGMECPNGSEMWQYRDSTTKGNLLPERINQGLVSAGFARLQGVAPGILEDARDALNPFPLFTAAMASGFPDCELSTKPVGDLQNRLVPMDQNVESPQKTWIDGPLEPGWPPRQSKWIQKNDAKNNPIFISEDEFNGRKRTHNFDGTIKPVTLVRPNVSENFSNFVERQGQGQRNDMFHKLASIGILIGLVLAFKYVD